MTTERQLTEKLATFFPSHRDVIVGIGDDAAIVRQRQDQSVLCCDPVIAGIHFEASAPLHLVGKKAVNRNLSDLAAMGACPDWLLVSLVLPKNIESQQLTSLLRGIRTAAQAANCFVVGGDIATSPGPLVVTVSAFGHLPGRALTRTGARAGDTLHVSGPLGGSRLGHHLRFRPALAEGVWLAKQPSVSAAMDVSDGLLLDLATMLRASSKSSAPLGAEIDANHVPIRQAAHRVDGNCPLEHALHDGEDHVLLWSQHAHEQLPSNGPLTTRSRRAIGRIVREPGLWLLRDGLRVRLSETGFQHEIL